MWVNLNYNKIILVGGADCRHVGVVRVQTESIAPPTQKCACTLIIIERVKLVQEGNFNGLNEINCLYFSVKKYIINYSIQ